VIIRHGLTHYDGSAGILVDTNVWVDCIDAGSSWHEWAIHQLQICSEKSPLHINFIIDTELLVPGPDVQALYPSELKILCRLDFLKKQWQGKNRIPTMGRVRIFNAASAFSKSSSGIKSSVPRGIDALLDIYDTLRSPLPWRCAALAAKAFVLYRRRGGTKLRPMPDFYIGAHAAVSNLSVLTRDSAGYASYLPRLKLIAGAA
jgi:predicted nucleic acid-binding protein